MRRPAGATALAWCALALLGGARAAQLEAMGGCALNPAQDLRVLQAEPTRLVVRLGPKQTSFYFGRAPSLPPLSAPFVARRAHPRRSHVWSR